MHQLYDAAPPPNPAIAASFVLWFGEVSPNAGRELHLLNSSVTHFLPETVVVRRSTFPTLTYLGVTLGSGLVHRVDRALIVVGRQNSLTRGIVETTITAIETGRG
jgi:hypothetical protein